jgi:hypothetical protein
MNVASNPQVIIDGLAADLGAMARTIHTLRAENLALQQALGEASQRIATLQAPPAAGNLQ